MANSSEEKSPEKHAAPAGTSGAGAEGHDGLPPPPPPARATEETANLPHPIQGAGQQQVAVVQPARGQQVGAEEAGSSRRRRGRPTNAEKEAQANKEAPEKPKRKAIIYDVAPEVPRKCSVCGKEFNNWKALFGHMRSHPKREWRGAFPPPISPPASPERLQQGEELAASLLDIGQRLLADQAEKEEKGTEAAPSPAGESSVSRRKEIDLNEEPAPSTSTSSSPKEDTTKKIDLNQEASEGSGSGKSG